MLIVTTSTPGTCEWDAAYPPSWQFLWSRSCRRLHPISCADREPAQRDGREGGPREDGTKRQRGFILNHRPLCLAPLLTPSCLSGSNSPGLLGLPRCHSVLDISCAQHAVHYHVYLSRRWHGMLFTSFSALSLCSCPAASYGCHRRPPTTYTTCFLFSN